MGPIDSQTNSLAPQVVQPELEPVDEREKMHQYINSYGPEVAPNPPHVYQSHSQQQKNPFGLSPLVFGLLVGAITAIIMGAALGGGLGGTLSSCQSEKSKCDCCDSSAQMRAKRLQTPSFSKKHKSGDTIGG
jgi:hypothetical protein